MGKIIAILLSLIAIANAETTYIVDGAYLPSRGIAFAALPDGRVQTTELFNVPVRTHTWYFQGNQNGFIFMQHRAPWVQQMGGHYTVKDADLWLLDTKQAFDLIRHHWLETPKDPNGIGMNMVTLNVWLRHAKAGEIKFMQKPVDQPVVLPDPNDIPTLYKLTTSDIAHLDADCWRILGKTNIVEINALTHLTNGGAICSDCQKRRTNE